MTDTGGVCRLQGSRLNDQRCKMPGGAGPGPAWTHSLVLYTGLRATLDVLRASSLMMFEVGPD